ncbi:MAG TPA: sulfatase-like hydrolase/transferase [Blastocatellia bacterium]|nr:sulfatase-like hydrolase/transferase [Blastocatellia bacterium]
MAIPKLQPVAGKETLPTDHQQSGKLKTISPFGLISTCAVIGAAGFFLMNVLEQLDLNWRLNATFASVSDRFVLLAYSSINILVGVIVGALVGIFVAFFLALAGLVKKAMRRVSPRWLHATFAFLFTAGITAIVLNQFSRVNSFVIGMIRELEKLGPVRESLLNHERSTSYLILMAIVTISALMVIMIRASAGMNRSFRLLCIAALTAAVVLIYYADSRVEVQLYEYTLHRSLYLAGVILSMTLAGTIGGTATINHWWKRQGKNSRRFLCGGAIVFLASCVIFTFLHFGRNQHLKAQLFLRSTQAKQNFLLAWWALDRDRDGYSALLDGGDADDTRAEINPGIAERDGDGIDNNGLAGDLTRQDLDDWRNQHEALQSVAPSVRSRFNIIYFFIDAVRADHLSAYGYNRKTTPNLDRLAEKSMVFENAFSPAARTSEAIPRFMQSSYWDTKRASWTEELARNDYNVMLFPGRRSWERYARMMPVARGAQGKPLRENIDFVIETLKKTRSDRPFCAYVYIPDPHLPYVRHPEFAFGSSNTDLYDGELAYTDFYIGRLLDWLEQSGRLQDTMIVVMSDHGESLGERDVYRHATQLYNEQTRVPMIIYHPEVGPRRVSDYVSTIDLGSTLLSANGIACPDSYLGINLLTLLRGESVRRPPVYAEVTKQEISKFVTLEQQVHPETKKYMAISYDGLKIIFNRDVFSFELYDLKQDPREEHNLYSVMPEKAAEMTRLVLQYVDIVTASRPWDADEGRYSKATGSDGDKVED